MARYIGTPYNRDDIEGRSGIDNIVSSVNWREACNDFQELARIQNPGFGDMALILERDIRGTQYVGIFDNVENVWNIDIFSEIPDDLVTFNRGNLRWGLVNSNLQCIKITPISQMRWEGTAVNGYGLENCEYPDMVNNVITRSYAENNISRSPDVNPLSASGEARIMADFDNTGEWVRSDDTSLPAYDNTGAAFDDLDDVAEVIEGKLGVAQELKGIESYISDLEEEIDLLKSLLRPLLPLDKQSLLR